MHRCFSQIQFIHTHTHFSTDRMRFFFCLFFFLLETLLEKLHFSDSTWEFPRAHQTHGDRRGEGNVTHHVTDDCGVSQGPRCHAQVMSFSSLKV